MNKAKHASSLSKSKYGHKDAILIEILKKLRAAGAQADIELPTLVFCGNQSAGKSSLIEAIAGVPLPRSDGTCTRCPMEIRLMASDEPWRCQVSVRWEFDSDGQRLDKMEERPFGNPITNPNEVEINVRRAQKAVLNPKQDQQIYESYLFGTKSYINDAATNLLKFSKNIICIEIRGEDTLNLSLIDLPGIIRHTESKEERHLVTIIEELVQQYITNENSIVIATIACKDDIENQAIVSMAREIDPEGQRTLGVLTKPDTIEKGCHEMWVKIFKGEAHQLRLGYFLVKNPTKAELDKGISFEHARKSEMDFFSRSPWTSLSKKRMGVDNLAATLSDILLSAIRTKVPDIKQDVTSLLDKCRESLRALPDPPNLDPHLEACCLINKFVNRLQSWIDADNDSRIWQSALETFAKFKKDIRNVGPRFGLKSGSEEGVTSRIELAELGFAYKKRKISIQDVERIYAIIDDPHDDGSAILDDGYTIVTEDQIEDLLHRSRGRQLPAGGFIPYQTLRTIVESFHGKWMVPTMECLSAIATTFATELEIAVEEVFGKYPDVAGIICELVRDLLYTLQKDAGEELRRLVKMEQGHPFTSNDEDLATFQAQFEQRARIIIDSEISTSQDDDTRIRRSVAPEVMTIMAGVAGYSKIAQQRIIDNIPMTIDTKLLKEFGERVQPMLVKQLGLLRSGGDLDVATLMVENAELASQRQKLLGQQDTLLEIRKDVIKFGI